jgi:hypothetical protein
MVEDPHAIAQQVFVDIVRLEAEVHSVEQKWSQTNMVGRILGNIIGSLEHDIQRLGKYKEGGKYPYARVSSNLVAQLQALSSSIYQGAFASAKELLEWIHTNTFKDLLSKAPTFHRVQVFTDKATFEHTLLECKA